MDMFADDNYYLLRMKDILDSYPQFKPPQHPTKLSDHIYIGNQDNADDVDLLSALEITHVLNVAGTRTFDLTRSPYPAKSGIVSFLMIPAQDYDEFDIMQYFPEAITFLDKAKVAGGKAFVHCSIGVNRSGAVAAAYLMVSQRKPLLDVVVDLKAKRLLILCNMGFRKQLIRFARCQHLLDYVEPPAARREQPAARREQSAARREQLAARREELAARREKPASGREQPDEGVAADASNAPTNDAQEQQLIANNSNEKNGANTANGDFETAESKLANDETFDSELQNKESGNCHQMSTNDNNVSDNLKQDNKNQNTDEREETKQKFSDPVGPETWKSDHHEDATYCDLSFQSAKLTPSSSAITAKLPITKESQYSMEMWNDISNYNDDCEAKKAEILKLLNNLRYTALNAELPFLESALERPATSKAYKRTYTNYQSKNYDKESLNESNDENLSALSLEYPKFKPLVGSIVNGSFCSHIDNDDTTGVRWNSQMHVQPLTDSYQSQLKHTSADEFSDSDNYIPNYFNHARNTTVISRPATSNHASNLLSSTSSNYNSCEKTNEVNSAIFNPYYTSERLSSTSSLDFHPYPKSKIPPLENNYYNHIVPHSNSQSQVREYFPKIHAANDPPVTYSYTALSSKKYTRPEIDYSKPAEKFVSEIKPISFYRNQVNSALTQGLKNHYKLDDHETDFDNYNENIFPMKTTIKKNNIYAGADTYTSGKSKSYVRRYSIPAKLSADVLCQPRPYVDKNYTLENFQVSPYKSVITSSKANGFSFTRRPYSADTNGYHIHPST